MSPRPTPSPAHGVRTVLRSKLEPPATSHLAIGSTHPIRLLCEHTAPVTVLVAPAGAGKSVALSTWVRTTPQVQGRTAWATLDRRDDDLVALWSTLLASLGHSQALTDQQRVLELRASADTIEDGILPAVLDVIGGSDGPLWWVLDDLHVLQDRRALDSLALLLTHQPANLHLVLSSRHPPNLPLHRPRLESRLHEIPPEAFALNREETAQLLTLHGLELDADLVDELWARTEGWAAGLRLAISGLRNSEDPVRFIAAFSGESRPVAELIISEVLANLPPDLRRFLLLTSPALTLTAALAEQLTDRRDAGAVLEELHRRNVLTQRLPGTHGATTAYRYHDLLRSYLRTTLQRTDARTWRHLHGQLTDHHAAHGEPLIALEHAIAAGDAERAAAILHSDGAGLVLDGHVPALEWLLATMPEAWLRTPVIGLIAVECALDQWNPGLAEQRFSRIDGGALAAGTDPFLRGLHSMVCMHRARMSVEAIRQLEDLDASVVGTTGDHDLDLLGRLQRGTIGVRNVERGPARRDLEQVVEAALASDRGEAALVALGNLAAIALLDGDTEAITHVLEQADAVTAPRGWIGTRVAAQLDIVRTKLALWHHQPEEARRCWHAAASALDGRVANPDLRTAHTVLGAQLEELTGSRTLESVSGIDQIQRQLAELGYSPSITAEASWTLVRLWLENGDVAAAEQALRRVEALLDGYGESDLLVALLERARQGPATARRRLHGVLRGERPTLLGVSLTRAWVLEARLAADTGASARSFEALLEAVRRTATGGLAGLLITDAADLRDLLVAHRGRFGPHEAFVAEALERSELLDDAGPAVSFALTPTELEILRDLPTHRSIADIAAARQVSANTVKTHLKGIYRKLGVNSRREAVEVATRRGLR